MFLYVISPSVRHSFVLFSFIFFLQISLFSLSFSIEMDRSLPDDGLSEALHLNTQVNLLDQRAKELEKMVAYVSDWLEVFHADMEFASQRIQEYRESVANCENLTSRARNVLTALMAKDSVTVLNVPDICDPPSVPEAGGISDEFPDQAVVAQLRDLSCRLRSTTRDLHKVSEERVIEAQSSKVILDRAEDLLSSERQSLEQWLFLGADLRRKKDSFAAFAAVAAGAAADYRCWKSMLEDRVGALLAAGSASL